MPQEGRRSSRYRPFITCDDPRGVVECGTIRKQKNLNSVGGGGGAQSTTSYHLLEVSRGAQKLNRVVSSWSCGHSNNNERDMAKDLLKGALDLEESLAMLSRLQHSPGAFDDGLAVQEMQDMRSRGRSRLSGSSRDGFEGVIRNGVGGENVFPDPFSQDACGDTRLDSSEEPSTSSSQSSIVHSSRFVSPESSASSTASLKKNSMKPRGSSLIAKLMGLEYGRKSSGDGEKVVNQQKPEFDPDSPRARKHAPWESGSKRKSLEQMIEVLTFKRNIKTSLLNGDHWSPIALMKPSRFSCVNLEHPITPKPRAEVDEEMLPKMRIRTNPLAEANECEGLNFNEKQMLGRAKGKASSTAGKPRQRKRHSVEMNSEEALKASGSSSSSSRRKGERKKTPKSESHLASPDGDKLTISKPKSSSNSKENWPKNAEEVTDKAISLVNGKQRYRDGCERESPLLLGDSTRLVEDASQIEITDYVDDDQSSSNETPLSSSIRSNTTTALIFPNGRGTTNSEDKEQLYSVCGIEEEEEEDYICVTSTCPIVYRGSRKASTGENKLKELLLCSPPFINRVKELFELKGSAEKDLLCSDIDHNDLNARMLLDSANELAELHGYECSRACIPLPSTHKMSSVACYYTSLEQLLDEVCQGIESSGCYVKDGHSTGNLLLLVKEDLRSRRMVTGVWDIGWRNVGSADEIEEIARGIDQLVLDGLIEEILVDLAV